MSKESSNTETQNHDAKESHTTSPMVGDILRAKRESLGISQKEIADRLRLRVAIVQSIDSNDFQLGQVHTFTRGYINSYARAVGADGKLLLELFDAQFAKPTNDNMQSFSQQTTKTKHDNNIMKLTWGIFAIIVGISAVWWWQSEQNTDTVVSEPASVSESMVSEESYDPALDAELLAQPQSPNRDEFSATDNEVASTDGALDADSTLATEMEGEAATAETPKPVQLPEVDETPAPTIAMIFKADCWIQVQDVNGKTLWTGVKTAGQQLELEGQGPFKFVLGAPETVSLSISGEPVDLSRYTAGKVARFTAE